MKRRIALCAAVAGALAALAPTAGATINPVTVALTPATATAGSTGNLGTDITFSPTGSDSVKDLTLEMPSGLLANAAINGGKCLQSATPTAACQVGSGTITANILGVVGASIPATFDLVKPPSASDLAGLQVLIQATPGSQPTALGTPAQVTIRPPSDPAGVGLNIAFANIPDTFQGFPLAVHEINSTFNGLRFPDTCPATPAAVSVTADSYGSATPATGSAPLSVTGCGSEPFDPAFAVTVTKDSGDDGVKVVTDVTQTAAQAPARSVSLAFPTNVLTPNLSVGSLLCTNVASGTCKPVGAATATSPLYPTPLTGNAYLTGTLFAPTLTLVFGPPFSMSLVGQIDLGTNATTFTGIPDFPLTDLKVALNGGSSAVFNTTCEHPSGSATATLTSQNGDLTRTAAAPFTISPCVRVTRVPSRGAKGGKPRIARASATGLTTGKPSLVFQVVAGKDAGKLRVLTVELPRGLRFVRHRAHGKLAVHGVSVAGAKLKSAVLRRGHLVITLRSPVKKVTVRLSPGALAESAAMRSQARRHKLKRLEMTVLVKDARGTQTRVPVVIRSLHLAKR